MNTAEAIIGNEQRVLDYFSLPSITGSNHFKGECPICSKKGKFRLHFYKEKLCYICVCGSGNLFALITEVTGKDFKTVAREVDELLGVRFEPTNQQPRQNEDFYSKFNKLPALMGTPGQEYLHGRGIFGLPKSDVRIAPKAFCTGYDPMPAIIAVMTDDYGKPCYQQRTFLNGSKKADVEVQKRTLPIQKTESSVAVRMFPVSTCLAIAEGFETAMSGYEIYKVPAWATLSTSYMKRFRAPAGVEHLMILADNDKNGAGLAAAFACGHSNILAKNDVTKVTIRWPNKPGDFNDVLLGGFEVVEWELY